MGLSAGVSEDGRQACVMLDGQEVVTLDAVELDDAIWELVAARAAMEPLRRPICFAAMRIVAGDGLHVENEENGKLLAVHHPGLGWLGAAIREKDDAEIRRVFGPPRLRRARQPERTPVARPWKLRPPKA